VVTVTQKAKESALSHYKEDLEAATLKWIENKAKSKKYVAIAAELAEFEEVLVNGASTLNSSKTKLAPAKN
jgi:non-homologous end joining protein Ku